MSACMNCKLILGVGVGCSAANIRVSMYELFYQMDSRQRNLMRVLGLFPDIILDVLLHCHWIFLFLLVCVLFT